MYKFQHFVAKHRELMKILLIVLLFAACAVAVKVLHVNGLVALICYVLLGFVYITWVNASVGVIMQRAIKDLDDNCDPYPLLSETEKLLTYKNSENILQIVLMNRAVALADTGDYQGAYDVQKSINIDKNPVLSTKCTYYNNLFSFCMNLEKFEEAGVWYEKFIHIYDGLKGKRAWKLMSGTADSARALEAYRVGDYDKAIRIINSAEPKNMRVRISGAMDYARVCIAIGEKERAAEALRFVVENGNKLYCVKEAEAMLGELPESSL